jgi:hypothetical protein
LSLAVNRAQARDGDVLGAAGEDQVALIRVFVGWWSLVWWVVGQIRAAQQGRASLQMERHVGLQLNPAGQISTGGQVCGAATRVVRGVDRGLDGRGVQGVAVAGRAELAGVVPAVVADGPSECSRGVGGWCR